MRRAPALRAPGRRGCAPEPRAASQPKALVPGAGLKAADCKSARVSLWTELPEAQKLLAQAVETPPVAHEFRYDDGREWRYIGDIPRRLKAIREPFLDTVLRGSDHAAKALNFKLTVTQAIDDAREAAGVGQVEEGFHIMEQREAAE